MGVVHDNMMRHNERSSHIDMMRKGGMMPSYRAGNTVEEQQFEEWLYGALDGMSFKESATCFTGLKSTIYYGFEALNYRQVYIPSNTIKFAIAAQKLSEATNTIYAYLLFKILISSFRYCDFTHLYSVLAELTNFSDFQQYGQLLSRIGGGFVSDF